MKPIITMSQDSTHELWVYGNEAADCREFDDKLFTLPVLGEAVLTKEAALQYAKAWATAVGGEVEFV